MRTNPIDDQMSDAMSEGLGLARTCAGDHQQRTLIVRKFPRYAMLDGAALFAVQVSQIAYRIGFHLDAQFINTTLGDSAVRVMQYSSMREGVNRRPTLTPPRFRSKRPYNLHTDDMGIAQRMTVRLGSALSPGDLPPSVPPGDLLPR